MSTQGLLTASRIGYVSLVSLLAWYFISQGLAASSPYSPWFSVVGFIPILLPLKGIIQGRPYTLAWAGFILCLYLLHSLTLWWVSPEMRGFATVETLLLLFCLTCFSLFARLRGRELGLGLKKQKA
ncbi:DUF2069 domain-containing protein [Shewanella sp. NIFS-20-20]|uniref:DUF2069 domain-containing protein n=1 Tax=Shewanella sp. NIFS-20-20 TaxID=2853806 RepID=UPI001C49248D|nr:DUF2069 domain-containing protein [Shewanella sp. NIFS-20-20]MBV7317516.1 DUF2069 domain-containing protein [Shewanella sp. NIFS-20-20]